MGHHFKEVNYQFPQFTVENSYSKFETVFKLLLHDIEALKKKNLPLPICGRNLGTTDFCQKEYTDIFGTEF